MFTLRSLFILFGMLTVYVHFVELTSKELPSSFINRRKCPYFQQSGCLLTVLEDICDKEGSHIDHSNVRFAAVSDRCCCPEPFKSCTENEMDTLCKSLFDKHFKTQNDKFGDPIKLLQSYNIIREEILKANGECQEYLNSSSYECGVERPYLTPSIKISHQCEQLLWLYEELGFEELARLDLEEFDCSFDKRERNWSKNLKKRLDFILDLKDKSKGSEGKESEDSVSGQNYRIMSYQDRRKCRYWQQSGCLLDEMEKLCEGENEIQDLFVGYENVFLCCCPTPYKACRVSDADQNCMKAMREKFPKSVIENIQRDTALKGLQEVRKMLITLDENCQGNLAPVESFATCSSTLKPFSRHDLTCEMLSWQWEELGDGDKAEFQRIKCPFVKKHKFKNGQLRKGAEDFLKELDQKTEL